MQLFESILPDHGLKQICIIWRTDLLTTWFVSWPPSPSSNCHFSVRNNFRWSDRIGSACLDLGWSSVIIAGDRGSVIALIPPNNIIEAPDSDWQAAAPSVSVEIKWRSYPSIRSPNPKANCFMSLTIHSEKSKSFVGNPLNKIFIAPYYYKRFSLHVDRNDLSDQITRFSFQLLSTQRIVMASCVSSLTLFWFLAPDPESKLQLPLLTLMMMYCLGRGESLEDRLSARPGPGQKSVTPAPSVGVLTTLSHSECPNPSPSDWRLARGKIAGKLW